MAYEICPGADWTPSGHVLWTPCSLQAACAVGELSMRDAGTPGKTSPAAGRGAGEGVGVQAASFSRIRAFVSSSP